MGNGRAICVLGTKEAFEHLMRELRPLMRELRPQDRDDFIHITRQELLSGRRFSHILRLHGWNEELYAAAKTRLIK